MSTDNIDWPEGDGWRPGPLTNYVTSGSLNGKVYVLLWTETATDKLKLLTFDPCANAWTQTEQSYSSTDIWPMCSGMPRWHRDHFQCDNGSSAAVIWPGDPTLHDVPAGTVRAPAPPWNLEPAESRYAAQAETTEFALAWGGSLSSAGSWFPKNDGQLYSFATQTYRSTTLSGAPTPRFLPQVVALGDRFFIWGGFGAQTSSVPDLASALSDGAIYDPRTDRFSPISSVGAPAQMHSGLLDRQPVLSALTNGSDVFVVDATNGAGGVYASALDKWFPLAATTAPFDISAGAEAWYVADTTRAGFHVLDSGDLIWIGPSESRVASKRGGDWKSFKQGAIPEAPAGPAPGGHSSGIGYTVTQWTGSALVEWGPWSQWATGCDTPPPPGFGCDPLYITRNQKFGEILWVRALLGQ